MAKAQESRIRGRYVTSHELRSLLEESGFAVENLWYVGYGNSFGEIMNSSDSGAIFVEAVKKN